MSKIFSPSNFMMGIIDDIETSRLKLPVHPIRSNLETIGDLANSIAQNGLLQPIVARLTGPEKFEIVAGNRRFAACKSLGWRKIPCHVVELDEKEAFEVALIENIQRNTLGILDEARAFRDYVTNFGWGGASELARKLAKSTSYVTKRMQLLDLPPEVIESVVNSNLSTSIAEELYVVKDKTRQSDLARIAVERQLSFREMRELLKDEKESVCVEQPYQKSKHEIRIEKTARAFDRAIIALRLAMNRIGTIIENSEDKTVFKILMEHKNMLHEQIDMLMKEKRCIR